MTRPAADRGEDRVNLEDVSRVHLEDHQAHGAAVGHLDDHQARKDGSFPAGGRAIRSTCRAKLLCE